MTEKNRIIYNKNYYFLLYFWHFRLFRPFFIKTPQYSFLILAIFNVVLFFMSFFTTFRRPKVSIKTFYFFKPVFLIFVIVLANTLIHSNINNLFIFVYNMIVYGVLPIWYFSLIDDYGHFMKGSLLLSRLVFVIYIFDPLIGYPISGDYMWYGFEVILPVFLFEYINYYEETQKKMITKVYLLLIFIWGLVFANRMTTISLLAIWIWSKIKNNSIYKIFLYVILAFVFVQYLNPILLLIYNLLLKHQISSYSLRRLINFGTNEITSGRNRIWYSAITEIMNRPFIGYGINNFQDNHGQYPHNIFLQISHEFGLIISVAIAAFFLQIIGHLENKNLLKIKVFFLFYTFPKLMSSKIYYADFGFWMLLSLSSYMQYLRKKGVKYGTT